MRILVIEDDRKVASFIQTGLEQEGYAVDVLHDGDAAGEQARAIDYDAVVLDLMLPGRSGFQVLRDIRARKAALPVLILTAKDSLDERVAGLDAGADDYMAKPFALAELSARLRALLRRGAPRENVLRVADLEMDTIRRTVRRAGAADRPQAEGIRAARVPDAQQRSAGHQVAHHRARLGHPLRQRQQRRRSAHQLPAQQDRPGFAPPLIHTVRGVGYMLTDSALVTLTLRARGSPSSTRSSSACCSAALSVMSYSVLARWLDADARPRLDGADRRAARLSARTTATRPSVEYDRERQRPGGVRCTSHALLPGLRQRDRPAAGAVARHCPTRSSLTRRADVQSFSRSLQPSDMTTTYGRLRIVEQPDRRTGTAGPYLLQVGDLARATWTRRSAHYRDLLLWRHAARAAAGGRPAPGGCRASPCVRWRAPPPRRATSTCGTLAPAAGARRRTTSSTTWRARFNEALARLEQSMGEMRQFSAALAHELRTPLAALRGEIELALAHAPAREQRRSLAREPDRGDRSADAAHRSAS